ncbi:MAG: alpha/beta hydrolase-fold protein [Phycisphaerales bacterium]
MRSLTRVLLVLLMCSVARAQERQNVTFQINQTTVVGQSVFVLGSLPELGGNDVRTAVKLEPTSYPVWKATVSLPRGRSYTFQYYIRNDAPGQGGNAANGTPVGTVQSASTLPSDFTPASKTVFYHSGFNPPILWWRQGGIGPYQSTVMHDAGPGRLPGETRWAARRFGTPRQSVEFFIANAAGTLRDPPAGNYTTALDSVFLQDGELFNYLPAPSVAPTLKAFTPASPPTIFSSALNETRRYRVVLPRGYNQHTTRRYPVIYMHDGQNCFDNSTAAFGVEWRADETLATLTRAGTMREAIIVGVDNGPNRLNDYAAPDAGGWSDGRYFTFLRTQMKPLIDAQYRTLTDAANTAAVGSSMGAQASLYMGWDFTGVYSRIGGLSGAYTVFNSGFLNRVQSQPKRNLRLYIDSGDSGTASDNYWQTYNLRDNLLNPARAGSAGGAYTLESDLRHMVGFGQQHNESAWQTRLPRCFEFLFPVTEEPNELFGVVSASRGDVNDDDRIDDADLAALESGDGPNLDVDRDGVFDAVLDRDALLDILSQR